MAVNDNDVELLDSYLDGELAMSECEGLWRRLAVEADLSAELDRLRADAAVRQIVYSSLEPADEILAQLQRSIIKNAHKESLRSRYNRVVQRHRHHRGLFAFRVWDRLVGPHAISDVRPWLAQRLGRKRLDGGHESWPANRGSRGAAGEIPGEDPRRLRTGDRDTAIQHL